jgi:hypothetical protein
MNHIYILLNLCKEMVTVGDVVFRDFSYNKYITMNIMMEYNEISWTATDIMGNPNAIGSERLNSILRSITENTIQISNDAIKEIMRQLSGNIALTWDYIKMYETLYPKLKWNYNMLSANQNITWDIVKANPNRSWNYGTLSSNPNITWDIIKANPRIKWDYGEMSSNPNITWDIVKANPDKKWAYDILTKNPNITLDIIKSNNNKNWDYYHILLNPNIEWKSVNTALYNDWISLNNFITCKILHEIYSKLTQLNKSGINYNPNITWKDLYYTNSVNIKYLGKNQSEKHNSALKIQNIFRKWRHQICVASSIPSLKGQVCLHNIVRDTYIILGRVKEKYGDIMPDNIIIEMIENIYITEVRNTFGSYYNQSLLLGIVMSINNIKRDVREGYISLYLKLKTKIAVLISNKPIDKQKIAILTFEEQCLLVFGTMSKMSKYLAVSKELEDKMMKMVDIIATKYK